ncbi:MAG: XrtA system polysaccharide deacetylase [Thermodesulfobacteriota bacterium]
MTKITNYLTIDVEDYFQVSAFEKVISPNEWDRCALRVENNTGGILQLLAARNVKATFFIVGWIAERCPELVREIARHGHEIGCHSYLHRKIYDLSPDQFREDTKRAKDILEKITGQPVYGYRAPSYSITRKSLWALEILAELGFTYDSSIFPIYHDTYGIPDAPRYPFLWDLSGKTPQYANQLTDKPSGHSTVLKEYPLSTALILGRKVPVAGGGYFRLFPYWFTKFALGKINNDERKPFVFYLHPWEIDPNQPRFRQASRLSRFRHYNNLDKTGERLKRLLGDFFFARIWEGI